MHIEQLRDYCLSKARVTESFPFDEYTLAFKVAGKIFLIASLDETPLRFNVKCNPELAIRLREQYEDTVLPGYHMNKKHWNTIICNGVLNDYQLYAMIDNSYKAVLQSLPKKLRKGLE
jgi:predicted DNA-binding protein (MmcQ/YjbR family)